jgi:hypothetical protein
MNERTDVTLTGQTISRRGVLGLLAGALLAAGFAGAQTAEARRRGGHGRGRGRGHARALRRRRGGRGRGHGGRRHGHSSND